MKTQDRNSESPSIRENQDPASTTRARYEAPRVDVTRLRLITEGGTVGTGDSGDFNTNFPQ